jgi:hypothetical protein
MESGVASFRSSLLLLNCSAFVPNFESTFFQERNRLVRIRGIVGGDPSRFQNQRSCGQFPSFDNDAPLWQLAV